MSGLRLVFDIGRNLPLSRVGVNMLRQIDTIGAHMSD